MSWSAFDFIAVNLAREIRPGEVSCTGVNSRLPALACLVAKTAYGLDFTHLTVAGGIDVVPDFMPQSSGDPLMMHGTRSLFMNEDLYDLAARGGLHAIFLSAGQIDGTGRVNNSAIGSWHKPRYRLGGGGGAAAMFPTVPRIIVWRTEHSPRTLVDRVDFVTASGNVCALVTPKAVFHRRTAPGSRFELVAWHPDSSPAEIVEITGFRFEPAPRAKPADPMTDAERQALARLLRHDREEPAHAVQD